MRGLLITDNVLYDWPIWLTPFRIVCERAKESTKRFILGVSWLKEDFATNKILFLFGLTTSRLIWRRQIYLIISHPLYNFLLGFCILTMSPLHYLSNGFTFILISMLYKYVCLIGFKGPIMFVFDKFLNRLIPYRTKVARLFFWRVKFH